MVEHKYHPVFAGRTEDGEKIVVYAYKPEDKRYHASPEAHLNRDREIVEYHIELEQNEGGLVALSPGSYIRLWEEWDAARYQSTYRIGIQSPEWTGLASGTTRDLIEAAPR